MEIMMESGFNGEHEYKECRICKDPLSGTNDITLGCNCLIHANCLVHYIRMRLGDKRSLLRAIDGNIVKGVMCPYAHKFPDLNECNYTEPETSKYYFITTAELYALQLVENSQTDTKPDNSVFLHSEEIAKLQHWLDEEETFADVPVEKADSASNEKATIDFIKATTKPCPNCGFCGTHYHGHSCHHISPYGGCLNCSTDYCFQCLATAAENSRLRGAPNSCRCPSSSWSTFCSSLNTAHAVRDFLVITQETPYPHDKRCGCVICPDCRPGRPCSSCPGHCAVCLGFINPGPKDLTEPYIIAYNGSRQDMKTVFRVLLHACMYGDYATFKRQLSELTGWHDIKLLDIMSERDHSQRTLLHYACHENSSSHKMIAELILETCPTLDTNVRDIYGCTPLEYAVDYGNPAIAGMLMTRQRSYDMTLLTACGKPNNAAFIQTIILDVKANCTSQFIANIADEMGRSPLHIICNQKVAKIRGFGISVPSFVLDSDLVCEFMTTYKSVGDRDGNTPLHVACCADSDDTSYVIDILCTQMHADWLALNRFHQTPLHTLCQKFEKDRVPLFKNRILHILKSYSEDIDLLLRLADVEGNTLLHFDVVMEYMMDNIILQSEVQSHHRGLDFDRYIKLSNAIGHTPLFSAVISGNTKLVTKILPLWNCGISVRDISGNTLLHFAGSSDLKMLQLILGNCESDDIDVVNNEGKTPIHVICASSNELSAKLEMILHRSHHSLFVRDTDGNTPLHLLAAQDSSNAFQICVSYYSEEILNWQNDRRETVLHILCRSNRLHFLDVSGVNIQSFSPSLSLQDFNGFTPFHFASADGFCRNLYGIDPSIMNLQNCYGQTALMCAIKEFRTVAISALWQYQSCEALDVQDKEGKTAFYYACENNMESIVLPMLEKNPAVMHIPNHQGHYPIHVAAKSDSGILVTLFQQYIKTNMNPFCVNARKETFLHYLGNMSGSLIETISKHFDISSALRLQNINGDTPIHNAVVSARVCNMKAIVRVLAAGNIGDILSVVNIYQRTALHILCELLGQRDRNEQHLTFLQYLLEAGVSYPDKIASVMVTVDAHGYSPIHYLARSRNWAVLDMVFEKYNNIDINAMDSYGNTVFSTAFRQRDANTMAITLERFRTTNLWNDFDLEVLLLTFAFIGDSNDVYMRLLRALLNHSEFSADTVIFDNRRLTLMEYVCMRSDSLKLISCVLDSNRRKSMDLLTIAYQDTSLLKFAFSSIKQLPLAQVLLKYEPRISSSELMILRRTLFDNCDDHFQVVSKFIETESSMVLDCLLSCQDDNRATILHLLCIRSCNAASRLAILRSLLAMNRKVLDLQDDAGCTAIHVAMTAREAETDCHLHLIQEEIAVLLIQSGANMNILNHMGDSPVHIAARIDSIRLMDACIQSNFDFCVVDRVGKSVLHVACENYLSTVVQRLIGAFLEKDKLIIADADGNTALHILCKQGKDSLAKMLMAKLDPSHLILENRKHQTPLAMGRNRKEIKKLFATRKT